MSTTIVQDRYAEVKDRFRSLFSVYENTLNGQRDDQLHRFRRQAVERMAATDFPTRRDENWKYTSLNRMLMTPWQDAYNVDISDEVIAASRIADLDACRIVLVNGILNKELSDLDKLPAGMTLLPVQEALENETYASLSRELLELSINDDHNPFPALNVAFAKNGFVLHVEARAMVERPVHIVHLAAPTQAPTFINPQLLVIAGPQSESSVVETYQAMPGLDETYFTNVLTRVVVQQNAHFHHYRIQTEAQQAYLISNIEAHQHRDSTYSSYLLDLGAQLVRNNLNTILLGQNTTTNYYGVYFAKGLQHIDNQTFIDHAEPHCISNELYKGILDGRGHGVFNGKVIVRQDAQKTNAFQQNSSLVLSKNAVMDSKPQLEIFADDVRCSHGATIGQLDEAAVFYLRTRGLQDSQARQLLQHAFMMEVIENFQLEAIRDYAERLISEKLNA